MVALNCSFPLRVRVEYSDQRYEDQTDFFPVDKFFLKSTCVDNLQGESYVEFQYEMMGDERFTSQT